MKNKLFFLLLFLCGALFIQAQTSTLIDVWDFGASQLDDTKYKNHLNEQVINGWYDTTIQVGSTGNVFPSSWQAGILGWTGGKNDRLRTANTNLTRYDDKNPVTIEGDTLNGYIYVNGAAQTSRFLSLDLNEDDVVMLYCSSQSGDGQINFVYAENPDLQTDVLPAPSNVLLSYVAKYKGVYKIFDTVGKPSYYRVLRKSAEYGFVHGAIRTNVSLPEGYGLLFTNEAGKTWKAVMADGTYSVKLPMGFSYTLSLVNANGFVISSGSVLNLDIADKTLDVEVSKVSFVTVTGAVTGLDEQIGKLSLVYSPSEERVFVPQAKIDAVAGTYTVDLEPEVEYTISSQGVNDYVLTNNKVNVSKNQVFDLKYTKKPVYAVTINAQGLTTEQMSEMTAIFTNLKEDGYAYEFTSLSDVKLRDGVYGVKMAGLDKYPFEQALTSNLTVAGQDVTKSIKFNTVTEWDFDDKIIAASDNYYKGLQLSGGLKNEVAKGHLVGGNGASMLVPVAKGDKLTVSYYYKANFSINGGEAIETNSNSTSKVETVTYLNESEDGVTITLASTSYITNIRVDKVVAYAEKLTVGVGKEYATINEALDAVKAMERPNAERVKIMIEPGNYEEMLVVDVPNVSLVNAAVSPSIDLKDGGVNIHENAVRITSYYGHGYNYYSMADNQKWNAEVLAVNKENGYLSYENKGSGSTNGSYWNATVVVTADGFEAHNIILENSFNQYISKKESEDVVEQWAVGSKGERPTAVGSTDVQNKNFVERAAALALVGADKVVLNKCRVIGRQDSFYGGDNVRVAVYKGVMMGATDYLFGEMTAVFYQSDLAMNTSEDKNDVSYITAAKQNSGRGYLMYKCTVTSAEPGVETASAYRSKPGYFGRPWQPNTAETVFYKTTIETSNNPSFEGQSLIVPAGWNNSLSGESPYCSEFGTIEKSGVDNMGQRVDWSTVLTEEKLADGTEITPFNFTKGTDGWDPFPALIEQDATSVLTSEAATPLTVSVSGSNVIVKGFSGKAEVAVFGIDGTAKQHQHVLDEAVLNLGKGMWVISVNDETGCRVAKVLVR